MHDEKAISNFENLLPDISREIIFALHYAAFSITSH